MSSKVWSQDHVGLNIQKSGIIKLINSALDYYLPAKESSGFVIKGSSFTSTIKQSEINQHSVMQTLQQYVNISGPADIPYTVKWDSVSIDANYNTQDLKVSHQGSGQICQTGLGISIEKLKLHIPKIEICEFFDEEADSCLTSKGFYGRFEDVRIGLKRDSKLAAVIGIKVDASDENIQLFFNNVATNLKGDRDRLRSSLFPELESEVDRAQLEFNFKDFYMPPPILHINGKSFEMDVTQIKEMILSERDQIAAGLTGVIANFLAKDLVTIVNSVMLKRLWDFKSQISLVNYDKNQYRMKRFLELSESDPAAAIEWLVQFDRHPGKEANFTDRFKYILRSRIDHVKSSCELKRIETPFSRDLSLFFDSSLKVNRKELALHNKTRNGFGQLGQLSFIKADNTADLAIGVSETYLNGLLRLVARSKVMEHLFKELFEMPGVELKGLNIHILPHRINNSSDHQLKLIANLQVRISELDNGSLWSFGGIYGRVTNQIGTWLERDFIWFPVEMDFRLDTARLQSDGQLRLYPLTTFEGKRIKNSFRYPMKDMSGVVESAVMGTLRKTLGEALVKPVDIDLSEHLQLIPGVQLRPKYLRNSYKGHLILGVDFEKLDFTVLERELNQ